MGKRRAEGGVRRRKQGNKKFWTRAEGGATPGISSSFNTWVISSKSFSNVGQRSTVLTHDTHRT